MRNLKKMFILCTLALVFTTVLADTASAQGVMSLAATKAITLFQHVKGIMFIVGGFGLVAIAWQAIFGKVKWAWFAGLAVGLAILAAASAIISYATGTTAGADTSADNEINDTFTESGGDGI